MQEKSCLQKLDIEARAEFWAALALRYAKNIGIRSSSKLLYYYGSALNAINNIDTWEDAKLPSSKTHGIFSSTWYNAALEEWNAANKAGGEIILYTDYRYPNQLKELVDAPSYFYAKGDSSLLLNVCLAIVGSRDFSIEGAKKARDIAKKLSQSGITIVSGLAKGIDRNAHIGAAQAIGSTIAVLGSGLEIIYPKENEDVYNLLEEKGLIISEFSPFTNPEARNFPIRNRLISGLALGVLIVEAGLKSGSLITARNALEQNRNVYAIGNLAQSSSSASSEGCQMLIAEGAMAIDNYEDILRDLPSFQTILEMSKIQRLTPPSSLNSAMANDSNITTKRYNPALNPPPVENKPISKEIVAKSIKNEKPKTNSKRTEQAKTQTTIKVSSSPKIELELAGPEAQILKFFRPNEKLHIDQIIEASGLSSSKINASLTILELQKKVRRFTGSYFAIGDYE